MKLISKVGGETIYNIELTEKELVSMLAYVRTGYGNADMQGYDVVSGTLVYLTSKDEIVSALTAYLNVSK